MRTLRATVLGRWSEGFTTLSPRGRLNNSPESVSIKLPPTALDVAIIPPGYGVAILAFVAAVVLWGPLPFQIELLPTLGISTHGHLLKDYSRNYFLMPLFFLLTSLMSLVIMPLEMRMSVAFVTALVSMIAVLGIPSYDEHEDPDAMFQRIMAECKYMTEVGTVGGSETLEEFEQ